MIETLWERVTTAVAAAAGAAAVAVAAAVARWLAAMDHSAGGERLLRAGDVGDRKC